MSLTRCWSTPWFLYNFGSVLNVDILNNCFNFLDKKVFVTTTTTKLVSRNSYLRLSLWVYSILSSLLLLPLPKSTSVFLCLSSRYYPGLGFHYAPVPLEVSAGHFRQRIIQIKQIFCNLNSRTLSQNCKL